MAICHDHARRLHNSNRCSVGRGGNNLVNNNISRAAAHNKTYCSETLYSPIVPATAWEKAAWNGDDPGRSQTQYIPIGTPPSVFEINHNHWNLTTRPVQRYVVARGSKWYITNRTSCLAYVTFWRVKPIVYLVFGEPGLNLTQKLCLFYAGLHRPSVNISQYFCPSES